jgi:hypothetical protein
MSSLGKKMTTTMNYVVLPSLHNVVHNGACGYCYTILLSHITTHYYHWTLHVTMHCYYYILSLLRDCSSFFHNTKSGEHKKITKFNIKQPWPKQKQQQRDDGKLAHLKKDNKGHQEGDMLLVKHFTQVRETHKQSKLLSLQQATTTMGNALHTTSKNPQRTRSEDYLLLHNHVSESLTHNTKMCFSWLGHFRVMF